MRCTFARVVIAAAIVVGPRAAIAGEPSKSASARAEQAHVTLLPSVIEDGARRRPTPAETEVNALLNKLDELLADTARDMGLEASSSSAPLPDPTTVTDRDLFDLATSTKGAVIAATARPEGDEIELRVSLASPSRRAMHTRTERFSKDDLAVRAVVMLRDVVQDAGVVERPAPEAKPSASQAGQMAIATRSEGRAVLAANATIFGGMLGFSVERASGSDDPRLLYPLLAVGAGVGLGASLLIADEWDVGTGDAWFLSSGGVWPTAAAHLIYEGRFGAASGHGSHEGDRWTFGLVGGTAGITLATLSLALGDMEGGGAVLAHSGGAMGLGLGALTEWFVRGATRDAPFAGMGYGAALGWLAAAGAASTRVHVTPMRVLSIDLGLILGGLAGAALASPLVVDGPSSTQVRGWVGAIAGGGLLGGGVALWLTRSTSPSKPDPLPSVRVAQGLTIQPDLPEIGVLPVPPLTPDASPPYGVRLRARF